MENVQYNGINSIIIVQNIIEWRDKDNQLHRDTCGQEPKEVKEILNSFHIDSTAYSHDGMCVISFNQNKQKYVLLAAHRYYNNGDTEVHVSNNPDDNGIPRITVATYNKDDKNKENLQIEEPKTLDDWAKFCLEQFTAEGKNINATGKERLAELQKKIQTLSYMLETIKMRVAMLQLQQANRENQNSL